ncbi:MAG: enoyl-CoA hydratase/isomerase family protein [Rhizobiaceae bacterium]|nr:enoyl-CoA hydratase/isomerase family protein [Rhizobiaceae bacterium]MCV0405314.1 enoyl-CoA hydratase/isomerase family protein [Rhizobiaceae bacterium]
MPAKPALRRSRLTLTVADRNPRTRSGGHQVRIDDFGGGDDIVFEQLGRAGVVTLNRPKALNAVNHDMILALGRALDAWETDSDVDAVVVKAEGRAFSAGGDILDIYKAGKAGNPRYEFFADEYRLNARLYRFTKPYVSLIDGIVMGGGVGISCHGSHRVMTENAVFAMPEVGIGFFPDVGGSRILSAIKGEFGTYLGLTGTRIRYGDALWAGLATHAVSQADLPLLVEEIAQSGDPDRALQPFRQEPPRETDDATLHEIANAFLPDTIEDLVAGLKQRAEAGDAFCRKAFETICQKSPTSLKVSLVQIRTGVALSMDECMAMEYRILNRMLVGHDFYEGIRAVIVDKDNKPVWKPADLAEVSDADVAAYFAPLGDRELEM